MLCPFKFSGNAGKEIPKNQFVCEKEKCAWWVEKIVTNYADIVKKCCAIKLIAEKE